jgi:hypothetical protein
VEIASGAASHGNRTHWREGLACPFHPLLSPSLPHFPHEPEASDLLERVTKSPPGASAVRVSLSARLALSPRRCLT